MEITFLYSSFARFHTLYPQEFYEAKLAVDPWTKKDVLRGSWT